MPITQNSPARLRIKPTGENSLWQDHANIAGAIQTSRSLTLAHKKGTNLPSQSPLLQLS